MNECMKEWMKEDEDKGANKQTDVAMFTSLLIFEDNERLSGMISCLDLDQTYDMFVVQLAVQEN